MGDIVSEQQYLGNTTSGLLDADAVDAPVDELQKTRLEADAELHLALGLTAQQDGDWESAAEHTAAAAAIYTAITAWARAQEEVPC
ncbi:hypothetical protein [Tersicoccus sp. Bi-70]|uniref:hypothetical protein n=1 Tax=Tersicoccus sp. Bi-70 TaxID=1897634 RepID=UPI000975C530|nr:hypothetical protein [Tersicoccus sp. Bi-70]OMH30625.1 hypothetical protein BGP79_11745 [Tersicoccus sp. Bi-70]